MSPRSQIFLVTSISMVAFAGNSLLCRLALDQSGIDPGSFTGIRLVSGAVMLWLIVQLRRIRSESHSSGRGSWSSALALFAYAASFSFAYVKLPAATGALLLFGAVQVTMIGFGVYRGERLRPLQIAGLFLAFAGLIGLLWPGLSAPPLFDSLLMLLSGIAWGVYTLRGRGSADPLKITADNFLRSLPFALVLSVVMLKGVSLDPSGVWLAIASGAVTSGVGYALWYWVLPSLKTTSASIVQLSVPVIAVFGGAIFLNETITLRLMLTSLVILGGILLVILETSKSLGES